jgi:hypothetical protein
VTKVPKVDAFNSFGTFVTIGTGGLVKGDDLQTLAVYQTRDFDDRAAITEYDGNLPKEIAEGLALLDTMPPPQDFSPQRWHAVIEGAARFADRWGRRALDLGWRPIELWGLHWKVPLARMDACGLAFMLADGDVVDMNDLQAEIRKISGSKLRYRRCLADPGAVLAWQVPPGNRRKTG